MLNPEQNHIKTVENCWTKPKKKNIRAFVFPYSNSAVACRVFIATYNIHAVVALVLNSVCCDYCFLSLFCWGPSICKRYENQREMRRASRFPASRLSERSLSRNVAERNAELLSESDLRFFGSDRARMCDHGEGSRIEFIIMLFGLFCNPARSIFGWYVCRAAVIEHQNFTFYFAGATQKVNYMLMLVFLNPPRRHN